MPPGTNTTLNDKHAHADLCQGDDFVTHSDVELKQHAESRENHVGEDFSIAEVCRELFAKYGVDASKVKITHQVRTCAMCDWEHGDRCCNPVEEDSYFCAECVGLKLCKTSGIWHYDGGQNGKFGCGLFNFGDHIPPHPIDLYPRTKRAEFCSDRCRNLWRDTKQRRERGAEIAKLVNGGRSERYAVINNYYNSGQTVILDKQTSRIIGRIE